MTYSEFEKTLFNHGFFVKQSCTGENIFTRKLPGFYSNLYEQITMLDGSQFRYFQIFYDSEKNIDLVREIYCRVENVKHKTYTDPDTVKSQQITNVLNGYDLESSKYFEIRL